jgi:aspartate/methionine/tyrosine aminotransferase
MSLSDAARAIRPTLIREFRARATSESLDLGIGQPDLPVPEPVRRAATEAIAEGRAPYSDNLGLPATRRAVADHYGLDPDQTMITCGVQEGLAVAIFGLVDPGDEVLVPDPGFPAYPNLVRAAGAEPVAYRLDPEADFALDPEEVAERVTDKTSAIVLNSPSNPTGRVHRRGALSEVVDLLEARDIRWIADDIYENYLYDGVDHTSPADLGDAHGEGLRLGGLSKSMHVMGWRLGWVTGPADWIGQLKPLHQHLVTCAPTPAQQAAVAALGDFEALFGPTLETFAGRRDLAVERSRALPGIEAVSPEGAFYLFLDARAYTREGATDSLSLAEQILDETGVVLIPGSGFGDGGEGFLRIAYTVDRGQLSEAFDRLDDFFTRRNSPTG